MNSCARIFTRNTLVLLTLAILYASAVDSARLDACSPNCAAEDNTRLCTNGIDDDGDGGVDCYDSDCIRIAGVNPEKRCGNRKDEDCDGLVDCSDTDCKNKRACVIRVKGEDKARKCRNQVDDDGDGTIDCDDQDCLNAVRGIAERKCKNNKDDDCDGDVDCDDQDCRIKKPCVKGKKNENDAKKCRNGVDDDGDGYIDCDDQECIDWGMENPEGKCNDGYDNDCDGDVDCDDQDCQSNQRCGGPASTTTTLPKVNYCRLIWGDDNPQGKLDVVFVGSGFNSLTDFRMVTSKMKEQLVGGDAVPPYKGSNKIAVWRVEKDYDRVMDEDDGVRDGQVTSLARECPFFSSTGDRAVLLSVNPRFISHAYFGGNAHVCIGHEYLTDSFPLMINGGNYGRNREDVERTLIHETGHSFISLRDEYTYAGYWQGTADKNCVASSSQCSRWDGMDSDHDCIAGCSNSNWWRSADQSLMNSQYHNYYFNDVCKHYVTQVLNSYSG
ncbi:MAG: hypothetical protein ABIH11_03235 [Candidatus Altiarchaeota archaeon]